MKIIKGDLILKKEVMCDNHKDIIATHINENDPYCEEINHREVKVNYCDDCWKQCCDDI